MLAVGIAAVVFTALLLLAAGIACFMAFGRDPKREAGCYDTPDGEQYERYAADMRANVDNVLAGNCEEVFITSSDGIILYGRYYHHRDGAPLVILFHGYRSNALRDVNGAYKVCKRTGLNILSVDQRAHGKSGGRFITFGIKERRDCLDWVSYATNRFGRETKVILMGLSMGASTVLMAAGTEPLSANIKAVAADCPYSDIRRIIETVIGKMKLPKAAWHFVRSGAKLFGGFDPQETSPLELVKNITCPVLFIHGARDSLIDPSMSEEMYNVCTAPKQLLIVAEADHGMSYFLDNKAYEATLTEFFMKV